MTWQHDMPTGCHKQLLRMSDVLFMACLPKSPWYLAIDMVSCANHHVGRAMIYVCCHNNPRCACRRCKAGCGFKDWYLAGPKGIWTPCWVEPGIKQGPLKAQHVHAPALCASSRESDVALIGDSALHKEWISKERSLQWAGCQIGFAACTISGVAQVLFCCKFH